jgi:protocatechuate 3,4-dioxygenase beta subunit
MMVLLLGHPVMVAAQDVSDGSPGPTDPGELGAISGRVSGIDSSLIGVAHVTAWAANPDIFEWGKGFALVDSQFSFRIDSLAAGEYFVVAEAPGYLPQYYGMSATGSDSRTVTVSAGQVTSGIDFALHPGVVVYGGSISGQVMDADGRPLPFVNIVAEQRFAPDPDKAGYMDVGFATSDENGKYLITGLAADDYYVRADYWNAWSGQTLWYPQALSMEEARPVAVTEGGEVTGIDFSFSSFKKEGSIKGQVLDAQGQPIANAGIQFMAAPDQINPWNWIWLYANTDAEGRYQIDYVPNGAYVAYCWAQSGWEYAQRWWPDGETIEEAHTITISDEEQNWQVDFRLPLTPGSASMGGRILATDGRSLANAYIQITAAENQADNATGHYFYAYASTDSDGYYTVGKLPAGRYIAYASCWEADNFGQAWYKDADSLSLATPVDLQEGEIRADINFTLNVRPIYGAIVGVVTDAATGEPLSRAFVQVNARHWDATTSFRPYFWRPYYAITDESGWFAFDWMPEGEYMVSVYASGAMAWYPDAPVEELAKPVIVVGGRKSETNFTLTLRSDGNSAITGFVKADYSIMPMESDGHKKSMRLEAVLDAYVPDIAIVMAKPALTILMWPASEFFYTAVTNQEGAYTLKGLPAGEYYVSSFAPGHMLQYYKETYDPAEADLVKVGENEIVSGIDFTLRANYWYAIKEGDSAGRDALGATITGTVSDENGDGLNGATVYLLNTQGEPISWATSDQKGHFDILNVASGQYYLQVGKIGFSTAYNGNVAKREQTTPLLAVNGVTEVNLTLKPAQSTDVEVEVLPEQVELVGNYPNPFNPETRIQFALPRPMHVTLAIFDLLGREVRRLQEGTLGEGRHSLLWDGRNAKGEPMSSGLYWYRLVTPAATHTGKMVMMK